MRDDQVGQFISKSVVIKKRRSYKRELTLALMMTTALIAVLASTSSALAQSQPAAPRTAVTTFNIRPQPLAQALVQFSNATGIQLFFNADIARGINSAGAQGSLTRTDALGHILAGSGLNYKFTNASTVTIQRPNGATTGSTTVPGAISLDTINVQGDNQSPYGPGVGYVATRSTAGSKTDTPIVETPQSISVVTRQQMQDQGVQDVRSALLYTSDVVSQARGVSASSVEQIYSRGFLTDQYQDGLKLIPGEFAFAQADPYFLERIEVLRGPASVLYGQADPGGIVNLVSKMPTAQPYHEIEIGGGTYNDLQGAFDLSGPIDKDGHFLYRLTGRGDMSDSQVDFVKNKHLAIAPTFKWSPDSDTSLTILTNYQHDPAGGFNGYVPAYGTVLPDPHGKISSNLFTGDPDYNQFSRTQYALGYIFEHHFDSVWTIRQSVRFNHVDATQSAVWPSTIQANLEDLSRYTYNNSETIDALTADNQIEAKFNTGPLEHTTLLGFDYQHEDYWQVGGYNFAAPPINIFNPVYYQAIPSAGINYNTFQTLEQAGLYAQDQIKFGQWRLTAGLREDRAKSDTADRLAGDSITQESQALTWRGGLSYLFDNGIAPYFSYATSFNPSTPGTTFEGTPFKPTTGKEYEAGIKYQPVGTNALVTASVYDLTEDNVLTTDTAHPGFSIQTGAVRSRGFDLEGKASINENLSVTAAYDYLDSRVISANDGTLGKRPDLTTVGTLPTNSASLWADYTFHSGPTSGMGFGGGVRYVGWTYGDPANDFVVPAVTLFDASFHYDLGDLDRRLKGFKLQVTARNLFDKQYIASCATDLRCFFGYRRTILAVLKYQW